jgi:hypothetical protein
MTSRRGAADAVRIHHPTTRPASRRALYLRRKPMTDISDTTPSSNLTQSDRNRLFADILTRNKTALFDILAATAVTHVLVIFDGYGDSGQIESIEAKAGEKTVAMPQAQIGIARAAWGTSELRCTTLSVEEAVEQLVYDLLRDTHGGWENNDGAYGDFVFDVAARTITLNFNERYTASDHSQHVF